MSVAAPAPDLHLIPHAIGGTHAACFDDTLLMCERCVIGNVIRVFNHETLTLCGSESWNVPSRRIPLAGSSKRPSVPPSLPQNCWLSKPELVDLPFDGSSMGAEMTYRKMQSLKRWFR